MISSTFNKTITFNDIMFSSCLTIGDAIAAAGKIKSMLRLTEIEHELATETSQESQEHILHSAANPRWKGVKVCLESETINSVIPRIFLILSIGTVYGSDAALYAFSLYHEFGSRGLVDNLNSHGFCASYSEVRRFLTSVALKEEESIKEGVYVPDGIVPVCEGGCLTVRIQVVNQSA
jgi:hypothetical protein